MKPLSNKLREALGADWRDLTILLASAFTGAAPAHAQIWDDPVFRVYGMEAGLSQGSANALLQDAQGFIWIGTQDGLNRFDGVSFRAFKHSRDDTTSLSDDLIHALERTVDGRLWVGTERGGLNLFDPQTGKSVRFGLTGLGPWLTDAERGDESREGRTVWGIVPLSDGSLVLSTDVGLVHFMPWGGGTGTRLRPPGDSVGVSEPRALCGLEGGGGLVGFGDGSVFRIGPGARLDLAFRVPGAVSVLRCPKGGPGFVATREGHVFRLAGTTLDPELLFRLEPAQGMRLGISGLVPWPGDSLLWVGTDQGLFLWTGEGPPRAVRGEGEDGDLPSNDITGFLVDATGLLWVGTWNGLASVHPLSPMIRRLSRGHDTIPGLSGSGVVSLLEGEDGGLWIGTLDGGVDRVDAGWRDGPASFSRAPALERWGEARVFRLARGGRGELWMATLGHSVLLLDGDGETARIVPVASSDGRVRSNASVYSVFVDHRGAVWAGTGHAGLTRYEPESGRFEEYRGPAGDWSFGSTWVWPIAEDASGTLWVGAFNGGVTAIDPARGSRRSYSAGLGRLSDNRVLSLYCDSRGWVWIGTQGGGLNRIDPETDEVRVYTVQEGLPHDHVEGIVEDGLGFLWISTNDGLARLDPETEEFWVLKQAAGLAGNRFFANAALRSRRGELLFGGPDGVTILDPSRVTPTEAPPRVALTGLLVHGRPLPLARVSTGETLVMEPGENFFAFQFAALDFADPTQNRYRYMLEGLDGDWIDAGSSSMANYTAVRPGRYRFRVAARNADGVWNEEGLVIPVRVEAPYHRTWWFRSVLVATVLLAGAWAAYRRISEHRRRFDVASRLHDGIGANIASIIRSVERIAPAVASDPSRREELGRVATLARRAQTETKAAVRILRKGKEADTVESLVSELRDTAEWMLQGSVRYEISIPEEAPRRVMDWKARTDVCLLFNEALNNVLKHAEATFVEVVMEYRPPDLHLRVADNGKGFEPDGGRRGDGLELMRQHATRHGGEVTVRSKPGEGTVLEARVRVH